MREGDQLGHFVIHEIKLGVVVCSSGDQLRAMVVERDPGSRSLVRNTQPNTRVVGAAVDDAATVLGAKMTPDVVRPNGQAVDDRDSTVSR